ncbi:MAG: hypothetical protein AAGF60_02480 [Pseudomonadota bacterium]
MSLTQLKTAYVPPAAPALDAPAAAFLNHLRFTAMECRIKPRADLFEACALLQTTRVATREAYSSALMRCLNEALGQRARLLSPGEAERSFDEDWLIALGRACGRGDEGSVAFLLGARVPRDSRRLIRFLVGRIAECFSLN